jgi:hypothetical protein
LIFQAHIHTKIHMGSKTNSSIIDYIIVNDKFETKVRNTWVFRGSEINGDHLLLEIKYSFYRWGFIIRDFQNLFKFKTCLLEGKSIRLLYVNNLKKKLIPTSENSTEDWTNIQQAILEAAYECPETKPAKHKICLIAWNEDGLL